MTNNAKETERAELHKTIWRIANDLRGSVDGWDFKTYVLGILFYRFISENLTGYLNEQERRAGNPNFDYACLSDADAEFGRAETVREKGFYILPSELFANVRAKARHDANLNETLSRIFVDIEASAKGSDSEDDIKGLFDDLDVNSSKLGATVAKRNEKLVKLLDAIGELPLSNGAGSFSKNNIDLFGDAYEYLMQMYASTAGKSGGEFYTPQEVSELLACLTVVGKTEINARWSSTSRGWWTTARSPRTATTSRFRATSNRKTPGKRWTFNNSMPRSPRSLRGRPHCAPPSMPSWRIWKGSRHEPD